jgi:hypothetical protein
MVYEERGNARVPAHALTDGARVLADYPSMQAISVPEVAVDRVAARLAEAGFELIALEETIRTPRRTIDPRGEQPPDPPFEAGLFLLQFAAPATPAWQAFVRQGGVDVIESIPERAVIVSATAQQVQALSRMPWVQYAGPYLPSHKFGPDADEWDTEFNIQMARTLLSATAVTRVRERVGGFVTETAYGSQITAHIKTDLATARDLLNEPFVLGVEKYIPLQPSDERQALSLSGAASPSGAYLSWLATRGITPNALTSSGIVVDIADSGVDMGCGTIGRHPDLAGRIVYHNGTTGSSTSPAYKDTLAHGTVVAGIVAGNPGAGIDTTGGPTNGLNARDSDGYGQFYWGLGVAPGVRIGNTTMTDQFGAIGTVADWTTRAVTQRCNTPGAPCPSTGPVCVATVQNYSLNEYDATGTAAGKYTTRAREYDISVRNADRATMKRLAITFSAGNYRQRPLDTTTQVLPGATAKNVIAVGAAESVRTAIPATCQTASETNENPLLRNSAQGYNALAYVSRRGTADGRLKPDLLAPATLAFGPKTLASNRNFCAMAGPSGVEYTGGSGTSFAAPVAAGAIALLQYHYINQYGLNPSPAMYKAMLVAGAQSITGAIDRQTGGTVAAWPNAQQGFGRIRLTDLLDPGVVKSWRDQQTILVSGQITTNTVTVADPAKPVRIVLAWTDAPAAVEAPVTLVNNLDLRVQDAFRAYGNLMAGDGFSAINPGCGRPVCAYFGDVRNNAEVINLPSSLFTDPAKRTFTVKVIINTLNGIGVPGQSGGANNQDFALFVLNGTLQ